VQRICLALLTAICLVASVHGPGRFGSFLYWLLGLASSLAGTAIAWRQVLLQSDPVHQLSACTLNVGELFASAPWMCVVQQMFKGNIDCAQISWTLFDLSIPEWSLLFFVAMVILSVYQLLRLVWISFQRPLSGESSQRAFVRD
jgi:disulfide bond formation protein DsbB